MCLTRAPISLSSAEADVKASTKRFQIIDQYDKCVDSIEKTRHQDAHGQFKLNNNFKDNLVVGSDRNIPRRYTHSNSLHVVNKTQFFNGRGVFEIFKI